MKIRKAFLITNEGQAPFVIRETGRVLETLEGLRRGPLPAPAYSRRSDHVFRLRGKCVEIETEMRRQRPEGQERYGVYHLKSKITLVEGGEE